MKTNLLLIIFSFLTLQSFGQRPNDRENKNERMEALRIAYITDALSLTVEESKTFWPICNAYDLRKKEIMAGRKKHDPKTDLINEEEASKLIEEELKIEMQLLELKKQFVSDLKGVIPQVKIAKFLHAKKQFRRDLLDKMKGRRKGQAKRKERG